VPTHVLSAALYERFSSRGEADFANQVLSAMRHEFGGHVEKSRGRSDDTLRPAARRRGAAVGRARRLRLHRRPGDKKIFPALYAMAKKRR
jgi:hypothetical protein